MSTVVSYYIKTNSTWQRIRKGKKLILLFSSERYSSSSLEVLFLENKSILKKVAIKKNCKNGVSIIAHNLLFSSFQIELGVGYYRARKIFIYAK